MAFIVTIFAQRRDASPDVFVHHVTADDSTAAKRIAVSARLFTHPNVRLTAVRVVAA